jgi:hypothetical protein
VIAPEQVHAHLEAAQAPPSRARAVAALARVEGRRLVRHPAIIVPVLLVIAQTAPFLLSDDATQEKNVGWLLQISALMISFGALIAANLQALKSRRDGSEELFQAAPLTPAARTVALALAAVWVMVALTLLLLLGDLAIRAAGKGAASDSGRSLFPLFDLVQGPLLAGLFVVVGIAMARWLPTAFAAPVVVTGLLVGTSVTSNLGNNPVWVRLTPFDPTFLDDGGALAALHAVYLAGLATVVVALAIMRLRRTPGAWAWLAGGSAIAAVAGTLQMVW